MRIGLKTMVGVGLSEDLESNEIELRNGIEVARAGHADILAVGNEVMLREDLTEEQLIDYIQRARAAVPGVPVGTVDAYFSVREPSPRGRGLRYPAGQLLSLLGELSRGVCALVHERHVSTGAEGRRWQEESIISETGWPSVGSPFGSAMPSYDNALEYFIRTYQWAHEEAIEIFYFSSFDEAWKVGDEGRCRRVLGAVGQGRQPEVCLNAFLWLVLAALLAWASDRWRQWLHSRPGTQ